jgi:NAD(P)-dependent dehydrogenase (short-subunit alcohol dehydrogenase family)
MDLAGSVIVVTGAGGGIGSALCARFSRDQPEVVVAIDNDADRVETTASIVRSAGTSTETIVLDVSDEQAMLAAIQGVVAQHGRIDLLCQNAAVFRFGGTDASPEAWERSWQVNVMAHVYGARAVLPSMLERRRGYILNVCSAAGLLADPAAAPYTVTKHAAVAFAEWLAMRYRPLGIGVSAVCPKGVDTPMLDSYFERVGRSAEALAGEVLAPEVVAQAVVAALAEEQFLILPHAGVADEELNKVLDRDAYLASMPRLDATAD